jgi:hypothetical protein
MTIIIIVIIVIFVVPAILAAVMYFVVIGLAPTDFPGSQIPTGTWGAKTVLSNTAVNVDFGRINPEPRPMDIEIILVRNLTFQGTYVFAHNDDGDLTFVQGSGNDVCDMTYSDLANNQRVNIGDSLMLTNLYSQSD